MQASSYSSVVNNVKTSTKYTPLPINSTNILGFFTLIGPFFIMFMLFILSVFNANFKGFVYLFGVFIMGIFIKILKLTYKDGDAIDPPEASVYNSNFCTFFGTGMNYSSPSFNSSLYIFTLTYLCLPMISKSIFNLPLFMFFILIYAVDAVTRNILKCTNITGILLGSFIGFIWGVIYYNILSTNNNTKEFLYYSEFNSNKTACLRPSKQKFKCNVYKNGELLQTI